MEKTSSRSLRRSHRRSHHKEEEVPQEDLMERFHEEKICAIPPTSLAKKPDIFALYRPKSPRECMNYNISQTNTKMDAGPTKIHVEQTRAEYEPYPDGYVFEEDIPPPTPKRKKRSSHGRGPVWLFMDEELKRKYDAQQKIYVKEMEERLKRKAKSLKLKKQLEHDQILQCSGPDWFQELSPDQISIVDKLGDSIRKDIMKDIIANTQECLASLGLVLRPNHRLVEIALKHCCENPVEFLLILYQLIDPYRRAYSVNDRLLLSAVVHLSMRSFLRELHIRIPSPPSHPEVKREKKTPKKKHVKYKSPYLVPFTFEPEPPKHTGVYKNRHIQYPESPYFSYLDELRKEMKKAELEVSEADDLSSDNQLTEYGEGESVMSAAEKEIDDELAAAQQKYDSLPSSQKGKRLLRPSVYKPCEQALELFGIHMGTEERGPSQHSKCCGGDTVISISVDVNVTDEYDGNVQRAGTNYQYSTNINEKPAEPKFIIVGITIRDGEAIPIIGGVIPKQPMDCKCTRKGKAITSRNQNSGIEAIKEYGEKDKTEKEKQDKSQHEEDGCSCDSTSGDTSSTSTFTSSTSVSTVGPFVKRPLEEPPSREKLLEVKQPKHPPCGCKGLVDIAIESAQKKIECIEHCGKKNPTLILADTKLDEEEKPIPIIAGVKGEKKCTCLDKYRRTISKYEELKDRQDVQDTLKSCEKKFQISGVTIGPDGKPVYVLSGLSPERPCKKCEELKDLQKREEERLANMPDGSQLREKFVISGVFNSPAGNVYVLSGVVPAKECECMKLYNAFMEKHALCMDIYERYMKKVKKDTEDYMSELAADGKYTPFDTEESAANLPEEEEEEKPKETTPDDAESTLSSLDDNIEEYLKGICECTPENDLSVLTGSEPNTSVSTEDGRGSQMGEKRMKRNVNITRFIVLDKIPCDLKSQNVILKKALASMARDGFPLAMLPHVHKLPHLKLWMALRCGKYWTMEDRERLLNLSKFYWHHLDVCSAHVVPPRLPMNDAQARKYTWASAAFIKKLTHDIIEDHCRKAKQGVIEDGREFFPSMFDYPLPTKTFRDCYFAYIPGKEESVFSYRPWKVFEYTDYKLIRHKSGRRCV